MASRKELRALDPDIIDKAISLLARCEYFYSCNAIWGATRDFDREVRDAHIAAYKSTTCVLGMKPLWWDSDENYSAARIQALEDFRDAIIVAKNPTIWERIKAWLSSPCEIPT